MTKGQASPNDQRVEMVPHPTYSDHSLRTTWDRQVKPRRRIIRQQLRQFGYEQFSGAPSSFQPETNIPVPPEYLLGPGDELQLHYFGSRNDDISLILDREGVVYLPDVGPITLANMSFQDAKALLAQTVRRKLSGVTASVTMGRLRSIRVFVLGSANHPGAYLVNGLSTISNALFIAGGISKQGSLRHILLKRNGRVVQDLDLYDFLLNGDSSHDRRLMPGDVIFIPPIGNVAAIAGEAVRPAIYELRDGKQSARVLLDLAGGLLPGGDGQHMQIDRITREGNRTLIDTSKDEANNVTVQQGDILLVYPTPGKFDGTVSLNGQVARPGRYGLRKGMTLRDLLENREDLLPDAFLDYALIQRTDPETQNLSVIRAPLRDLWSDKRSRDDIRLQDRDKIYVLSKAEIRPLARVQVFGEVPYPGSYPLTQGMKLLDLLLMAGGTTQRAFLKEVEITRYDTVDGTQRVSRHIKVDLHAVMEGKKDANIPLQADDQLMVRRLGGWKEAATVTIRGEVLFPGKYPVEEGERLSSLIARAGGLNDSAYLYAAIFTRKSIREAQKKKIADAASRIREDIAKREEELGSITNATRRTKIQAGVEAAKRVLAQLEQVKPTGRLVLELRDIAHLKGSDVDITLRDGDEFYVPKRPNEVTVMGQVYNNTTMLYQERLSLDDYIKRAGGLSRLADEDAIYVMHANGLVEAAVAGWSRSAARIGPGDVIVVPQKLETFDLLSSALDWSKVLYQIGVSLASMKTIGIL